MRLETAQGWQENTFLPVVNPVSCAQFEVIQSRLWKRQIPLLAVSDLLPRSAWRLLCSMDRDWEPSP